MRKRIYGNKRDHTLYVHTQPSSWPLGKWRRNCRLWQIGGMFESNQPLLVYGAKSIVAVHCTTTEHTGMDSPWPRIVGVCVCVCCMWHMRWEPEVIDEVKKSHIYIPSQYKHYRCRSRVQFGNQLSKRRGGLIEIRLIWHQCRDLYWLHVRFWLGPFTREFVSFINGFHIYCIEIAYE